MKEGMPKHMIRCYKGIKNLIEFQIKLDSDYTLENMSMPLNWKYISKEFPNYNLKCEIIK